MAAVPLCDHITLHADDPTSTSSRGAPHPQKRFEALQLEQLWEISGYV